MHLLSNFNPSGRWIAFLRGLIALPRVPIALLGALKQKLHAEADA
jgi:hypothetical protein